jgi:hypothetical protein
MNQEAKGKEEQAMIPPLPLRTDSQWTKDFTQGPTSQIFTIFK